MNITELRQAITAARERDDRVAVARLRFQLPLSERNEILTAADRASWLPVASVSSSRVSSTTGGRGWPTVALSPTLRNRLDDRYDGRETGGFLIGPVSDDGEIVLTGVIATSEGNDLMNRTATSTQLDLERALAIWEEMPPGETILGDTHVHPNGTNARPSSGDLRSWEGLCTFFNKPWLGLIACSAPITVFGRQTDHMELTATVTRRGASGNFEHREIDIEEI